MSHAQNQFDNDDFEELKLLQQKQHSPHKQTSQTNMQQEVQFQKNYPKNIFIPLLEYLSQLGYKAQYQKIIGTRADFEDKNVVSLSEIFQLINEDWFNQNICRQKALVYISNKILINSKIKKKLFHLLMSKQILLNVCQTLKDFKRNLSKAAYDISKQAYSYDETFDYPNIIIYLLNTFLSELKKIKHLKLSKDDQNQHKQQLKIQSKQVNQNQSSKQQYKYYIKQIVQILSHRYIHIQSYYDLYYTYNDFIAKKEAQFREKYKLIDGIPNWGPFVNIIILKCIQYKKKGNKITNFSFHQWINQYKLYATSIKSQRNEDNQQNNDSIEKIKEMTMIQPSCTSIIQNLSCFSKKYKKQPDTLKVTNSVIRQFTPLFIIKQFTT